MRCTVVTWMVAVSLLLGWCGSAIAQSSDPPKESPTPVLDRLNNLGKRIFGPLRQEDRDRTATPRPSSRTSPDDEPIPNRPTDRMYSSQAGGGFGTATRHDDRPVLIRRNAEPPVAHRGGDPPVRGGRDSSAARGDKELSPPRPAQERAVPAAPGPGSDKQANRFGVDQNKEPAKQPVREPAKESADDRQAGEAPPPVAGLVPIHQRLSTFRESFFGSQVGENPADASQEKPTPAVTGKTETVASDAATTAEGKEKTPPGNPPSRDDRASAGAGNPPDAGSGGRSPERGAQPKAAPTSKGAVFSAQSAALSVETSGPRKIVVGKEGKYEVVVHNHSAVAAEQVVVSMDLPPWTEIAGSEATAGTVAPSQAAAKAGQVRWLLPRLGANGSEKLSLRIVPRQGRPFELRAKVECAPPPSQAAIEVQEAKLALALHGPREVPFGKPETFKLELSNAGTADAENVVVSLTSSATGEKLAAATQRLGTLGAGQKKTLAMELVARQEGSFSIAIEARADNGASAQLAETIQVRRAKLKVDVEAPKVAFAGNEVTYRIRVSSQGTAPADRVTVQAILPRGAKYVSSLQNGRLAPEGGKVLWTIERLGAGADAALGLTCSLSGDGAGRLDVQCAAEGEVQASASAVTQVQTAPDLVLTVDEPAGPVGLDGEATYQVRVQNRGTAAADGVEVVLYFAKNLEPVSAEGARHRVSSGQVVFDSLPTLAAGKTSTFRVRAKADKAGNHIYRVEVHSASTGIRLVREGATRFYAADAPGQPAATDKGADREVRTADRRGAASQNNPRSPGTSAQ